MCLGLGGWERDEVGQICTGKGIEEGEMCTGRGMEERQRCTGRGADVYYKTPRMMTVIEEPRRTFSTETDLKCVLSLGKCVCLCVCDQNTQKFVY